jgi:hypothetical protein
MNLSLSILFCSSYTVEKELAISGTLSLPEGLHKVMQSDSTFSAPKLGGKKMSFRRKLTPSTTKEENAE